MIVNHFKGNLVPPWLEEERGMSTTIIHYHSMLYVKIVKMCTIINISFVHI